MDTPDIIGETSSGKAVLHDGAEGYSKDFTSEDHTEAAEMHKKQAAKAQLKERNSMLGKKTFNHRLLSALSNKQAEHADNAEYHEEQADQVQKSFSERFAKAFKQKLPGGLADKKKPSDFTAEALKEGAKVEMEHTDDPTKAKEIAMDHLTEDPKYYNKLKMVEQPTLEKKQGVPTGVDPDKHERCVKDVKAQGHDKSSAYAICNASIKKGFANRLTELLTKGGPGSGQRGHTTARKPYPGEESHRNKPTQPPKKTHVPGGGLATHYSDSPELNNYKNFIRYLKKEGIDFSGHISYDPKTHNIIAISKRGDQIINDMKSKIKKKP